MPVGIPRFMFRDDLPPGHDFLTVRRPGDDFVTAIVSRDALASRPAETLRDVRIALRTLEAAEHIRLAS